METYFDQKYGGDGDTIYFSELGFDTTKRKNKIFGILFSLTLRNLQLFCNTGIYEYMLYYCIV